MKFRILLLIVLLSPIVSFAETTEMLAVKLGSSFEPELYKPIQPNGKAISPVQFRVPNQGASANYFSEYTVILDPYDLKILAVSASHVFDNLPICQETRKSFVSILKERHKDILFNETKQKFELQNSDKFIEIYCAFIDQSPYPVLQFRKRSLELDLRLKNLWDRFLGESS